MQKQCYVADTEVSGHLQASCRAFIMAVFFGWGMPDVFSDTDKLNRGNIVTKRHSYY